MAYQAIPPASSGTGVGWDATQWTRVQTLLGTQVNDYQWVDLLNTADYDATSGAFAQLSGSTGGVLHSGVGSSSLYFGGQKTAAGSIVPIPNMKTSAWAIVNRIRIATAPAGAGKFIGVAGMAGSTHECSLYMETNVSTTVFQLEQIGAATTKTACSSVGTIGSGMAVSTWYDIMIVNDPSGGRVVVQINGVTAATSTDLTNQSTQACRPVISTNQDDTIDCDAMFLAFKREP